MSVKNFIFEKNLKALKERYPELSAEIRELEVSDSFQLLKEENKYSNCRISLKGKELWLYSKASPEVEIKELLEKSRNFSKPPRILFFYGLGLGHQLFEYLKNPFPDNNIIIVIEKELELFKLSLEISDFSGLFKSRNFHFFIAQPLEGLKDQLHQLWYRDGMLYFMNCLHNIIFNGSVNLNPDYYVNFSKEVSESFKYLFQSFGNSCNDQFIGIKNTFSNLDFILSSKNLDSFRNTFKGIPGFLLCSGPSLNHQLEQLKEVHKRGLVICCDSNLLALHNNGISAHFVTTLERGELNARFYRVYQTADKKDMPLLISLPLISNKIFENYDREALFIFNFNNATNFLNSGHSSYYTGMSCSTLALSALHILGCNPIIMIGNELSFDQETGETHVVDVIDDLDINMFSENKDNILEELGNNDKMLKTKASWIMFKKSFELMIKKYSLKVFNVSHKNGGLKIKGTEIKTLEEILEKFPQQYSSEEFTPQLKKFREEEADENILKRKDNLRVQFENYKEYLDKVTVKAEKGKELLKGPKNQNNAREVFNFLESFWLEEEKFNSLLLGLITPEHVPIMMNLYELDLEKEEAVVRAFALSEYWFNLVIKWSKELQDLIKTLKI